MWNIWTDIQMSDASFEAKQTLLFLFFLPKKTRERFGAGSDWLPQHKKVGPSPDWSLEPLPRCHSALGPSPPLLTAVPESLRQPASDRAPGRGRRDEVDSDFSFFPLNENEASCASVELLRGSSSGTRTRVWLFSVREETLRRVSGDFRIYWREV